MEKLLHRVRDIAIAAGEEILEVYENEFEVDYKDDGSPLTIADQRAHNLIVSELPKLEPVLPVLSEESDPSSFADRQSWDRFWLVDPLDGTKEFVRRNGEFTVNIALVENGRPVMGVVHAPVIGTSHFADTQTGAFLQHQDNKPEEIRVRSVSPEKVVVVASRSHFGSEVEQYLRNLERCYPRVSTEGMGSSLKICLVAEGSADVYPRLGPTSEWDTAAAHCVLMVAGGRLTDLSGSDLRYNKPDILNPWFLAGGDPSIDWTEFVSS